MTLLKIKIKKYGDTGMSRFQNSVLYLQVRKIRKVTTDTSASSQQIYKCFKTEAAQLEINCRKFDTM